MSFLSLLLMSSAHLKSSQISSKSKTWKIQTWMVASFKMSFLNLAAASALCRASSPASPLFLNNSPTWSEISISKKSKLYPFCSAGFHAHPPPWSLLLAFLLISLLLLLLALLLLIFTFSFCAQLSFFKVSPPFMLCLLIRQLLKCKNSIQM